MTQVTIDKIAKSYGSFIAVREMDIVVESGEFLTFLGPSGCGKTTTLQMVGGFVSPSTGRILVGDQDMTARPPHKRNVGMVFQNYALFPHMSVVENVAFGLRMRRVGRSERDKRAAEALGMVRMAHLADRFPDQISGGQAQRVALARALVIRPDVLLLDEPFGALDKQLRDHMRVELRELQQSLGISTIFVTHDQDEALSMSDRVVVMSHGVVQQVGSPIDIYERPATRFVAEFMGLSNILPVERIEPGGGCFLSGGLSLPTPPRGPEGGAVSVVIRPEALSLRPANGHGPTGKIVGESYMGATIHYVLELESGPRLSVVRQNLRDGGTLRVGDEVAVEVAPGGCHLLAD